MIVFRCLGRLSLPARLTLALVAMFAIAVAMLFGFAFGPFMPLESWETQMKLNALERHLYIGEPRNALEDHFGHDVPKPDLIDGLSDRRYTYNAGGAICIAEYRGVEVYYDVNNEVRSWKEYGYATGC